MLHGFLALLRVKYNANINMLGDKVEKDWDQKRVITNQETLIKSDSMYL